MALTVVTGLGALTTIGLDISVINTKFRNDEALSKHVDTIWSVDLTRRLILCILLVAAAYPAARFYGEDRLYNLRQTFQRFLPPHQKWDNLRQSTDFDPEYSLPGIANARACFYYLTKIEQRETAK